MSNLPRIPIREISDVNVQDALNALMAYLRSESPLLGFRHFEIVLTEPVTNLKYSHGLGFLPEDVLTSFISNHGSLTWNYAKFDSENLDLTVAGDTISATNPCVIRFFAGSYRSGVT